MKFTVLFVAFVALAAKVAFADEHSHRYELREDVVVWMNTIGPYNNRQETYAYHSLPFCTGTKEIEHHHETLGEVLQGMELVNLGVDISFRHFQRSRPLCTKSLTKEEVNRLRNAVRQNYWFQMFIDDLPVWGFIGYDGDTGKNSDEIYLYTHKDFSFAYNMDRLIEVNLTSSAPVQLIADKPMDITFTYAVAWQPTTVSFARRFEKYLDQDFFEHKIHWFSMFNSFLMVLFLVAIVSAILVRTLHRDYARYDERKAFGEDRDLGDEYGWKQVHADVFRSPPFVSLLSAMLGTGAHLGFVAFVIILYIILGDLYTQRSTILTATIFIYAVAAPVSGFFSGSFYARHEGKNWIRAMFMTASLWPGIVLLTGFIVHLLSFVYSISRTIHFGTIVALFCIWFFLVFPLTLVGTVIGRNWAGHADWPCRVNPIPRQIPEKRWYGQSPVLIALGGILPFGSIFVEMYFVFTSFWAYKIYYVYGFLLLVFIILLLVTACVTIVSTYFLLNSEDHRWHWNSFLTSASTAFYVFLYATYYFFARTKMSGFFQTSFYFSYTAVVCIGMFFLLGTVGYFTSEMFVRKIYASVKLD